MEWRIVRATSLLKFITIRGKGVDDPANELILLWSG